MIKCSVSDPGFFPRSRSAFFLIPDPAPDRPKIRIRSGKIRIRSGKILIRIYENWSLSTVEENIIFHI